MIKGGFAPRELLLYVDSGDAFGVAAYTPSKPAETGGEEPAETAEENWKIGIMTNTVVQNEERIQAAQNILKKYGEEHVIHMTFPDKFMDEQETTIANLVSMASDPDVKALIICQAVQAQHRV